MDLVFEQLSRVLPSIPYGPTREGYWGEQTSTINWCEEDYYATIYSAEIVNTLTNLLFAALAVRGIVNCITQGHDVAFIGTFVGYFIVGFGSFCFHASLKYPWQLVDELSMIYTTMFSCYAAFSHRRSSGFRLLLALSLVSLAAGITIYYHHSQNPVFHQNAYAVLTAIVIFRSMFLQEIYLRPYWKTYFNPARKDVSKMSPAQLTEVRRQDQRDLEILRLMWCMIGYGLFVFLGGFAIWQLDNFFCSTARRWRAIIGLPWGIILEGHGWWHIMTGVGAYFFITWGLYLRHILNKKQDFYELQWPSTLFSLPLVVKRKSPLGPAQPNGANGHANGSTKKRV